MKTAIRVTVEHYNAETHQVIESEIIRDAVLCKRGQLKDPGYLHTEQTELLQSLQGFKIRHQSALCNDDAQCPHAARRTTSLASENLNFTQPEGS